ncbi:MAG: hypothetical protein JNK85_01765 [Verrucomicrobiales bacterium]|nr:hypothetical protein [Verrucomicrobiales bacterium]
MKVPRYGATAGLQSVPAEERLRIYRQTHKRLLSLDPTYRRRWRSYMAAVVALAFVPVLGWVAIVYLAFRQQAFQNGRIGEALQQPV